MMATALAPLAAIHLAVLVDAAGASTTTWQATAVLVYDGCGYRHHQLLDPPLPAERLALAEAGPGQLHLPIDGCVGASTSSGLRWQTIVLPSIPTGLRGLPPEELAATFAGRLVAAAGRRP